jgi:hypothetical protein
METRDIRVHTCNSRIEGYIEEKCSCRKFVTQEKAEQLEEDGSAAKIIISYRTIQVDVVCPICEGANRFMKSCHLCGKSGTILQDKVLFEYGEEIYMRPFLKTPRTATIEEEHIEYAYVKGDKDAIRRIELYHEMEQFNLGRQGAELHNASTNEVLFEGRPEPENDPKKGQGRDYDYGRSI